MSELTNPEKKLLEPFAIVIAGIYSAIAEMKDDDLKSVVEAASHVSSRNCWWATYEAAPIASKAAREEIYMRLQRAKSQEPTP